MPYGSSSYTSQKFFRAYQALLTSKDDFALQYTTVEVKPKLSDLKEPGTSKLDWRYFEPNKNGRNELQICKNLQHGCKNWTILQNKNSDLRITAQVP